jgi:malonyl-CoA/methylmalonyl-CoA synthetase
VLRFARVRELAVFGVPCPTYGEKIAAVVVPAGADEAAVAAAVAALEAPAAAATFLAELKEFLKDKLPPYKVPTVLKVVPEIPRNAMGKINKKALRAQLFPVDTPPPATPHSPQ